MVAADLNLMNHKQSGVQKATISIEPLLKTSIREEISDKPRPNWRINQKNFVEKSDECEPGTVTFSAGWFAQGHTVSTAF